MSYVADDGAYDVYSERPLRARTAHACDACKEAISPGHTYTRVCVVFDRSAETIKRCWRCQRIHEHLRERCALAGRDMWPDERLACGHRYEAVWGELPADIAALAFALPGEEP